LVWSCLCQVSKVNEKDLQDQQCEYSPQALPEPASMISCLHDRFLNDQLLPTPHLYFLYLVCELTSIHSEEMSIMNLTTLVTDLTDVLCKRVTQTEMALESPNWV